MHEDQHVARAYRPHRGAVARRDHLAGGNHVRNGLRYLLGQHHGRIIARDHVYRIMPVGFFGSFFRLRHWPQIDTTGQGGLECQVMRIQR